MSHLAFTKMHGLGNDFIVVDLRKVPAAPGGFFDDPQAILSLCDRRRGVGADGVLGIFEPSPAARELGAVARLRIRNADASEAEMCGNGLRCVAHYLRAQSGDLGSEVRVETGAGVLICKLFDDGQIEIAMGRPVWGFVQRPFSVGGAILSITSISMGNPHAVVFREDAADIASLRVLAERYGKEVEHHPLFPQRTNVEFVNWAAADRYTAVVWERGCGITQACGTGACATAVAACLTGRAEPDRMLTVELPGGPLQIRVAPNYSQVYMRGPATVVFTGELPLS